MTPQEFVEAVADAGAYTATHGRENLPVPVAEIVGLLERCAVDDESPLELHCPHLAEIRRHVESLPAIAETRKYGWTVRAYASGRLLLIVDATRAGYFAIPMSTVERLDVQPIGWLVGQSTDAANQGEEERPCS